MSFLSMQHSMSRHFFKQVNSIAQQALVHGNNPGRQWICDACRQKTGRLGTTNQWRGSDVATTRRPFTSRSAYRDTHQPLLEASNVKRADVSTSSSLPSHTEKQRWDASKRWSSLMDNLLARASVAGQNINVYTGTDYSGIEALRQEIIAREEEVRKQHKVVAEAKEEHARTRQKQMVSQKEIVGLLERKASWSPTDLERYMTLVRSEHIDDQAVQKAAEEVALTETRLENGRSLLEKLERQQYHEEQIWSDTIRRNSTWVTISLMGINIVLLLAQISIFEPYRRRKIVDQIESALDQRAVLSAPVATTSAEVSSPDLAGPTPDAPAVQATVAEIDTPISTVQHRLDSMSPPMAEISLWQRLELTARTLLSEQAVQMRQYDRTALVVESVAAGAGLALLCSLAVINVG